MSCEAPDIGSQKIERDPVWRDENQYRFPFPVKADQGTFKTIEITIKKLKQNINHMMKI